MPDYSQRDCLSVDRRLMCVFSYVRMTSTSTLTYILWRRSCIPIMKFVGQAVQKLQPKQNTQTHFCFCDLDLDPMTLIHEIDLDILNMYPRTKNEVSTSRLSKVKKHRLYTWYGLRIPLWRTPLSVWRSRVIKLTIKSTAAIYSQRWPKSSICARPHIITC